MLLFEVVDRLLHVGELRLRHRDRILYRLLSFLPLTTLKVVLLFYVLIQLLILIELLLKFVPLLLHSLQLPLIPSLHLPQQLLLFLLLRFMFGLQILLLLLVVGDGALEEFNFLL